ncbi:hypothetical protein H7142_00020, partial [Candidatus Saccharibacteria bacterium]|nr:hypothetical protein [Candidatus Saccharibacteria bacterium]
YTYFSRLPDSGSPLNAATIPNGVYSVGGNVGNTLARLPESRGAGVILKSNGNFTISRDIIVNNSNLSRASDITQVVIVADNITIDENVKQIDAWLITSPTGSINTCGYGGTLVSGRCGDTLSINGPIYTNRLLLRRTAGANPPTPADLATPAERFNLRPDAQLWAYTYANKADYAQTDFVQELPPRY